MSSAGMRAVLSELTCLPLPEGWSVDPVFNERYVVIGCPAALCAIDVSLRTFRAGAYATHGASLSTGTYTGRGWVARLHADAVAWMRAREAELAQRRSVK